MRWGKFTQQLQAALQRQALVAQRIDRTHGHIDQARVQPTDIDALVQYAIASLPGTAVVAPGYVVQAASRTGQGPGLPGNRQARLVHAALSVQHLAQAQIDGGHRRQTQARYWLFFQNNVLLYRRKFARVVRHRFNGVHIGLAIHFFDRQAAPQRGRYHVAGQHPHALRLRCLAKAWRCRQHIVRAWRRGYAALFGFVAQLSCGIGHHHRQRVGLTGAQRYGIVQRHCCGRSGLHPPAYALTRLARVVHLEHLANAYAAALQAGLKLQRVGLLVFAVQRPFA